VAGELPLGEGGTAPGGLAGALAALGLPATAWESLELAPGAVLFEPGTPGDAFYVVSAGVVEAYLADAAGRRVVLERLGPGASFGELALLDDGPRTAGIAAVTAARLTALRRPAFLAAVNESPELAGALLARLGAQLRRNLRHVDYLIAWAGLVAEGRYDEAQAAIARAGDAGGADSARFVASFMALVTAVKAREAALAGEVAALRVAIDEARRAHQVAEVTETDFFRALQAEARRLRGEAGDSRR
jgi:CRP-like cAMP-binding protein